MAGPSQNVELEAAKFLHKLIQDSKDEPAKLATKLYVILQHMKSSGKEHSMPYQVISRAMETVINQHGLDIEALKSSRLTMANGTQAADSAPSQFGGPSQPVGVAKDSKVGLPENELSKMDPFASSRPPVGPSGAGHDYFQGPGTQQNTPSFDHESPSSLDSRSANSQLQERRDATTRGKQTNQKEGKKTTTKRKRAETSVPAEPPSDNAQQPESRITRKGKMSKAESSSGSAIKGGEHGNFNIHPGGNPMEQFASMSGSNRPGLRPKQGGQLLEPANNSMPRVPNSKFPEETEVTSTQSQQIPSVAHDNTGLWNQNKSCMQFEKPQVPRFPSNFVQGNMEIPLQPAAPSLGTGSFGKVHGDIPVPSGSFPTMDPGFSNPMQFGGSNHTTGKGLEHDEGGSNKLADAGKLAQVGRQNSASEMNMLKSAAPRDTGKAPVGFGMPFREQQLKQLRAQCLVFLAFRNGLIPKKMHLDIALGSIFPKEGSSSDGSRKEAVDHKGKVPSSTDPNNVPEVMAQFGRANNGREIDKIPPGTSSSGRFPDMDSLSKEAGNQKVDDRNGAPSEERKPDAELQMQETAGLQHDSAGPRSGSVVGAPGDKIENGQPQVGRTNQGVSMMTANSWTAVGNHDEVSRTIISAPCAQQNLVPEGKDNASGQIQNLSNAVGPLKDATMMPKHIHQEQREDNNFITELPLSPKYTMSEKWIMDHQKKKHLKDQKWLIKQQKTRHRIATCFYKLKENANSSEDISAKTKSVIELKKLQLLDLQRRLRSEFLNDFFKPIYVEVDRLKAFKKHKHGRRVKQLEKFEQKMKEERQKRIRERQKEFFGEIEVHKEKLDDVFKFKRERLKGFNKYAKEFHKRKERIHREKIDRIQREKINLLKINDVEGYLRMVQDAKSDRVKQLLKETEKYLQKLGSKLQEAKSMATRFEHAGDESGPANIVDKSETAVENEDESDQAKHYLESNEKYYLMAHSIKESIAEQPAILHGGKLREYQMNGLRWLVSLYNNHLNGILADEMGLGKTVQVISLICYLMETKNDRGPFLVVVPSSVLPGWDSEINFWAPSVNKIVYSGPPEERRRLFKERIVHQKFNVLLTTYEYLMNKHDRPKLSKIHWHYVIIDEGHRIKNASCKLNSDLKYYHSSHRLLLTGTPLQNNLDELWALLNFLLPNIFNSSEDFSQWFNKPFEGNVDSSPDQALLSEEENLLIINRLHQVLRPFVLRRLKHKVENELPEKIERLIRCEASAYQKLLMKRVEENLGSIGATKVRSVHNSVMELRNICNHPYISQLHAEEVDTYLPNHYLPPIIRHCGKLEMLDRLLPKLKATDHRVLFFSTMTRLLDIMEEYLHWKQYRYLRLDGHTSGGDRGALIDAFNKTESPYFIFLLSIRAGGVGVNLQAADTVIIFDTDWNPQVDLQAQARAHRIGQKRDVLVLRFETVQTVEEQVRASAEHKLGVANQSITAGFFDNNTSAEDRREYLEALLRECKKEEAAPVLDDDALNDLLARSESEIDVFESVDTQRREAEMATWRKLAYGQGPGNSETLPPLPSRLVTEDDLKDFYEAMKLYDVPKANEVPNVGGVKRKGGNLGGLDTQHYGRGKRTREVRSYEEQWTEEEFEKMCQVESPESPSKVKEEVIDKKLPANSSPAAVAVVKTELPAPAVSQSPATTMEPPPATMQPPPPTVQPPPATMQPLPTVQAPPTVQQAPPSALQQAQPSALQQQPHLHPQHLQQASEVTPPAKRGRGRPKRSAVDKSPSVVVQTPGPGKADTASYSQKITSLDSSPIGVSATIQHQVAEANALSSQPVTPTSVTPGSQPSTTTAVPTQGRGQGQKAQTAPRRRGKRQVAVSPAVPAGLVSPDSKPNDVTQNNPVDLSGTQAIATTGTVPSVPTAQVLDPLSVASAVQDASGSDNNPDADVAISSPPVPLQPVALGSVSSSPIPMQPVQTKGQGRKTQSGGSGPRRRGRKQVLVAAPIPLVSANENPKPSLETQNKPEDLSESKTTQIKQDNAKEPDNVAGQDLQKTEQSVDAAQEKQTDKTTTHDGAGGFLGPALRESQSADVGNVASVTKEVLPENSSSKPEISEHITHEGVVPSAATVLDKTLPQVSKNQLSEDKTHSTSSALGSAASGSVPSTTSFQSPAVQEGITQHLVSVKTAISPQLTPGYPIVPPVTQSTPYPSELPPGRRSGRKTPVRAEPPRRRGRRQASVLPVIPDGSAAQDTRLSSQSQNRSADNVGAKSVVTRGKQAIGAQEPTNVVKTQTTEVHSTAGLAGHDPKRKDQSSHTAQIKQPISSPATIDSAAGSTDRISAKGRIQTADVNDVARVMKEVFFGTRSKSKATESSGKEGRALNVSSRQTVPEVAKSQSLGDKVHSNTENIDMGAPGFPLKYVKQSGTGAGAKAEVDNTSVSNETVKTTDVGKPETMATAVSEKLADSSQPCHGDSASVNSLEAVCVAPLRVGGKHDGISQNQSLSADPSVTMANSNELSATLSSPTAMELEVNQNDSENKTEPLSKDPPKSPRSDVSGVECTTENKAGDSSGTTTPPLHDSSGHCGPQISHKPDDVSDTSNLGQGCFDESDLSPVEVEAVKTTVAGPEISSNPEDLGVGLESANANSENSNLCDASSSERNKDAPLVDTVNKGDVVLAHVDAVIAEHGTVSGNSDAGGSSSLLATEEKCDDSEKSPVGSSAVAKEPKGSLADDKLDVSNTPKDLPASSLVEAEDKIKGSYEKNAACSLSPPEAPKDSDAEMEDVFVSSTNVDILPVKASEPSLLVVGEPEKATSSLVPAEHMDNQFESSSSQQNSLEKAPEPSSPTGKASSLASAEELKNFEADMPMPLVSSSAEEILPDKSTEPLSCSVSEGEKIIHPSQMDTIQSPALVQEPKDSEVEMDIQINSSESDVALAENIAKPSSSLQAAEEKIKLPLEDPKDEDPKDSEAEIVVESDSYRDGGSVSEERILGPSPSVATDEEKIEGSHEQDLPCKLKETRESEDEKDDQSLKPSEDSVQNIIQADSSQISSILVENVGSDNTRSPPSSSAIDGEKLDGSTEKFPEDLSVQPMEPKDVEAKMESNTDACEVQDFAENKDSETLGRSLSSSLSGEEKIEDATAKNRDDSSETLNELKDAAESEIVGDANSTATEEENIASPSKPPAGDSVELTEVENSGTQVTDQMDVSQGAGVSHQDTTETTVLSSSPFTEVRIEDSSEKSQVTSPVMEEESKVPEAEFGDKMDVCEIGLDAEKLEAEEKLKDSTQEGPGGSSIAHGESETSKAEDSDAMDVCEVGVDTEKQEGEEKLKDRSEKSPGGSSVPLDESNNHGTSHQMDEPVAVGFPSNDSAIENVGQPSSTQGSEQIEGSSGTNQANSPVTDKVDLPSSIQGSDKIDDSSEKNQASSLVSERIDPSSPVQKNEESEDLSEMHQASSPRSEKVDQPLSAPQNEEIEGSSEKHQASSDASTKVDMPSSTQQNEETKGLSEKNQASSSIAVVESEVSEIEVNDQMETSQVSKVLSETDAPSVEDEKSEDKEGLTVVSMASQGVATEPENPVDDSEGCKTVLDNEPTVPDSNVEASESSEPEVKAQDSTSPVREKVPKCDD